MAGDITWDLERKRDGKILEIWTVGKNITFEDIDLGLKMKGLIEVKDSTD